MASADDDEEQKVEEEGQRETIRDPESDAFHIKMNIGFSQKKCFWNNEKN